MRANLFLGDLRHRQDGGDTRFTLFDVGNLCLSQSTIFIKLNLHIPEQRGTNTPTWKVIRLSVMAS